MRNLIKMWVPEDLARQAGNSCRGYWFTTHVVAINMAMTTAIYVEKTCILGTSVYNKAVIKKTITKVMWKTKKWGARTGGLRVSGRFNPEPDLDNANVGR